MAIFYFYTNTSRISNFSYKLQNLFPEKQNFIETDQLNLLYDHLKLKFISERNNSPSNEPSFIIFNIEDIQYHDEILNFFRNIKPTINSPKLIILSKRIDSYRVLYKKFNKEAPGSQSPIQFDFFDLHNLFYSLRMKLLDVQFLFYGLIYGENGHDFYDVLNLTWNKNDSFSNLLLYKMICQNQSLPKVHINDLFKCIYQLISTQQSEMFLYLASDQLSGDSYDNNNNLNKMINEINIQKNISLENGEIIQDSPFSLLQQVHLLSLTDNIKNNCLQQIEYENGFNESFDRLWNEFTDFNHLSPFRVALAGPPLSGKSSIARILSDKLQIPVLDILNSVNSIIQGSYPTTIPEVVDRVETLFKSISKEIEPLVNDPSSKKKNTEVFDVRNITLSDSLVSNLSPSLILECLLFKIDNYDEIKLKGFIFDGWVPPLLSFEFLQKIFKIESISSNDSNSGSILSYFDLVVELDCPEATLLERWLTSSGLPSNTNTSKLPKENQAAFKSYETNSKSYKSNLLELTNESSDNSNVPIFSHSEVVNLTKLGINLFRLSSVNDSSEILSDKIYQECIKKETSFGWLGEIKSVENKEIRPELTDVETFKTESMIDLVPSPNTNLSSQENFSDEDLEYLRVERKVFEDYNIQTFLPKLTEMFVNISRGTPDDPLFYAIEYLENYAKLTEDNEQSRAKLLFDEILKQSKDLQT